MTPPINSEISKKLRAAIRAKLEELGVYVDDELPDYIMVMIANKKEKKQMKDDLTLFLSKNTDAFVEWLFDIFHRLQSTSAAAPASDAKPVAAKGKKEKIVTKEKKKVVEGFTVKKEGKAKKKTASELDKEKEKERERKEKKEVERREIERANREDRERRERDEKEKKERELRREKDERDRREREEIDRRDRERERKEREQHDREKEEERQREREREKRREREREERETPPAKRRHSPIRTRRALSPDVPAPTASVRRRVERSPERRRDVVTSTITRAPSPPPVAVQSKVVVKRQVKPQKDKEGAKGASSMFLRAMNAASVSAGYGAGGSGGVAKVGRKRPAPTTKDIPQFSDEDEFANGDKEEDEEVEEKVAAPQRKKAVPARRIVQPPVEKKQEPRFIVTFNKKDGEEEGKKQATKRKAKDEDEDDAIRVSTASRKTITVSGEKRKRESSLSKEEEDARKRMSISVSPPHKHSSPSDWDGHINLNDDDETSDEEAAIDAMLAATRASRVSSRSGEGERLPPTSHLSRGDSYYEPYDPSQPEVTAIHVAPQAYVPTPLGHSMIRATNANKIQERCKFFPNCKEGEACIYLHPATRHCTNFPRCSFGSRCMYTHPKCKFDAACNNPTCPFAHTVQKKAVAVVAPRQTAPVAVPAVVAAPKLEEKNTKIEPDIALVPAPSVPTAVSCVRTRVPSTLMSTIPCRFAAGCTNPTCAYKHPTECRFGHNCRNSYCHFYHPPAGRVSVAPSAAPVVPFVPFPSTMKWKASAAAATTTAVKSETA